MVTLHDAAFAPAPADPPRPCPIDGAVRDAARYAEAWLTTQAALLGVPGLQVAVAAGDDVVLSRALGVADVGTGQPLTPHHRFRVASHSKTFTATLVLQLAGTGALRLDDRLDAWLDHLAGSPLGSVTVRDLLSHGAGVSRDSADGDFWQLSGAFPDAHALRALTTEGADVLPVAERFKYSNLGYGLLGLVLEAATGTLYADLIARGITGPLGLSRTGADWDESLAGPFATGHTARSTALGPAAQRLPIAPIGTGALAPATGVWSTAEDLVRFAAAHYHGDTRLLPDEARRRMQHPEWTAVREHEDYGLGMVLTTVGERRTVGHSGGFPGFITRTMLDPVDRFAVAVLTNAIDGPATALASTVVRLVDLATRVPSGSDAPDAELDRFTGRYANLWGLLDVVRLGGRLYALDPAAIDPTADPVHLVPVDGSTLRIEGGNGYGTYGETVRCTWAADGTVAALRAHSGQTMVPADRYRAALAARDRVERGPVPGTDAVEVG